MSAGQKEEAVSWKNGNLTSEGLWCGTAGNRGVVICHPHPLMGGSMYNNVVETVRDVFSSHNYSTLRFNFRGVGESTGRYDEGRGEQQDILSALDYMKSRGIEKITLVGYSFGAWVCSRLLKNKTSGPFSTIFISPPLKYFVFDWERLENTVELIICGDSDSFCDLNDLREKAEHISSQLRICRSTDHFYSGKEPLLKAYLTQYINEKKLDFN